MSQSTIEFNRHWQTILAAIKAAVQKIKQNLHSVIRNFLPKTEFMASAHMIAGVSLGIMTFNKGASALWDPLVIWGLILAYNLSNRFNKWTKRESLRVKRRLRRLQRKSG